MEQGPKSILGPPPFLPASPPDVFGIPRRPWPERPWPFHRPWSRSCKGVGCSNKASQLGSGGESGLEARSLLELATFLLVLGLIAVAVLDLKFGRDQPIAYRSSIASSTIKTAVKICPHRTHRRSSGVPSPLQPWFGSCCVFQQPSITATRASSSQGSVDSQEFNACLRDLPKTPRLFKLKLEDAVLHLHPPSGLCNSVTFVRTHVLFRQPHTSALHYRRPYGLLGVIQLQPPGGRLLSSYLRSRLGRNKQIPQY